MFQDFYRSLGQLFEPSVIILLLQVVSVSLLVILVFGGTLLGLLSQVDYAAIPWIGDWLISSDWGQWVASSTAVLAIGVFSMFCFPYVLLLVASLFQDRLINVVESRYYPGLPEPLKVTLGDTLLANGRFLGKVLLVNVLFLPVYLMLLFTGIGVFVLAALLNGYFLGVEFFQMVAVRRLVSAQQKKALRSHRTKVHLYGVLVYLLMLVPVWNLLMPLFACMFFTHLFYRYYAQHSFMTSTR